MSKFRIPRKLKKGCRTLNGKPRTKWQRKGVLHFAKLLDKISTSIAVGVTASMEAWKATRISPSVLPPGGIVAPPDVLKVGTLQRPASELVMNHEERAKLVRHIQGHQLILPDFASRHLTVKVESSFLTEEREEEMIKILKKLKEN